MAATSRPCMRTLVAAVVASLSVEVAKADQLINCNANSKWLDNASGESPCTVAYHLMLQCTADPNFTVLPLNNSIRSYSNPLVGQCTCNTVVYNLMNACAICQGGNPTAYAAWTDGCTDISYGYPNEGIALSFKTPRWAYVNANDVGNFNLRAVEEVVSTNDNDNWSTVQIILPIIIGVAVAIVAVLIFYFYRRRLKRRYKPIMDPYHSRPTDMLHDAQLYSQQSIPTIRPGHHHTASSSSLGVNSIMSRNSPVPKRKKSAAAVAWERARMHAPRKFGGLLPDRPRVHERTRGANWSIDVEPGESMNIYKDPWHTKQDSSSGTSGQSGLHSKETSGDSHALKETNASHSSRSRPATHGRSESQLGLLSTTSPESLHPIQDSPDIIKEGSMAKVVRGIVNGISTVGGGLRIGKQKPVPVVSRPAGRRFNVDDVDSTNSPIAPALPRGSRYESFVFVENEENLDAETKAVINANPADIDVTVNSPPANGMSSFNQDRNPSQSGSNGSGARSDGSGDAGVTNGENSNQVGGREGSRDDIVLIGQDFNSMASPTEETAVFGHQFSTSVEGYDYSPALTDAESTVLHPSFVRQRQVALPLPPAPPPTSTTQSFSRTNSPSHSAPGTPRPPSRIVIPQGNGNSQLLVPPVVRAAGGHINGLHHAPPPPPGALVPETLRSASSYTTSAVLPNMHPFSGSIAESNIPEPPSAVSNATTSITAAGGTASEHSSSHAYTVPNPFIFDHRRGGSAGAAEALRLASPSRSGSKSAIIE